MFRLDAAPSRDQGQSGALGMENGGDAGSRPWLPGSRQTLVWGIPESASLSLPPEPTVLTPDLPALPSPLSAVHDCHTWSTLPHCPTPNSPHLL